MIDYNLPGSFGANAEFHPGFIDRRGYRKFIAGRVIVVCIVTVVPAGSIMWTMVFVPSRFIKLSVFLNPFITVIKITMLEVILPVMGRPDIGPAAVRFRIDALLRPFLAMPVFSAVGPGSTRKYKH